MEGGLAPEYIRAAAAALHLVGPDALADIGAWIMEGVSPDGIVEEFPLPDQAEAVAAVVAVMDDGQTAWDAAGGYLRGLAAGYRQSGNDQSVAIVWSGPTTAQVPVRSTAQVVLDVVGAARSELVMTTYSAKPYEPLLEALSAAVDRSVKVSVVVETLQGAGSALQGAEPAAAFAEITGLELWHWPSGKRPNAGSKMHSKIIVADRRTLFATSANLTASGIERNIEAGVLVRGGSEPRRAVEHLHGLQASGMLVRYR